MSTINDKPYTVVIATLFFLSIAICTGVYFIGRSNTTDRHRITEYRERERELLARIGEYQQRELDRVEYERSRIAAEAERIAAARARIKQFEVSIGAIRGLDRRSSDLLQELVQEVNILADYFWRISNEFGYNIDYMEGN